MVTRKTDFFSDELLLFRSHKITLKELLSVSSVQKLAFIVKTGEQKLLHRPASASYNLKELYPCSSGILPKSHTTTCVLHL